MREREQVKEDLERQDRLVAIRRTLMVGRFRKFFQGWPEHAKRTFLESVWSRR